MRPVVGINNINIKKGREECMPERRNENDDYRSHMVNGLVDYTDSEEKRIKKILVNESLFNKEEVKDKKLGELIASDDRYADIVKYIEKFEYRKRYTFAFMYSLSSQEEHDSFDDFLEKVNSIIQEDETNESLNPLEADWLSKKIEMPTLYETEESIFFKFSLVHSKLESNSDSKKYPILCQFFKEEKVIALFFETISNSYGEDKKYITNAQSIERWFKDNFNIKFMDYNSFRAAKNLKEEKRKYPLEYEYLTRYREKAHDQYRGTINLVANANDKLTFIEELEELQSQLHCDADKQLVDNLLDQYDVAYDFMVRGFTWHWEYSGLQTSKINVVFKKNYLESGKTLIHFYSHNQNKERVNYVIRDVKKHREVPSRT